MSKKYRLAVVCTYVIATLSGCASTGQLDAVAAITKPTTDTEQPPSGEDKKSKTNAINLTPLSKFTEEWTREGGQGVSFSGAYTRLLITSKLHGDGDLSGGKVKGGENDLTPLQYKERDWWKRALIGKEYSLNLTAKVIVGAYETTVPLVTIGHESNSDGEQWNRVVHHTISNFPLFLVKTDGSASVPVVKLSVNGTKTYASRGAASAIQVALGVARATAHPASVITRLSEQSTKDQARAVDEAVSKLFSNGISEEHWTDRDLRLWRVGEKADPKGVLVEFAVPVKEGHWNSALLPVGSWTITFDYPRPSIFSDWSICPSNMNFPRCAEGREEAEKKVFEDIKQSEVLSYVLWDGSANLGTIRSYISQQDWYMSTLTALANANTNNANTATALCRRIANEITGLGLNDFDAQIVVWAVTTGMPMPDGALNFTKVADCNNVHQEKASDKSTSGQKIGATGK